MIKRCNTKEKYERAILIIDVLLQKDQDVQNDENHEKVEARRHKVDSTRVRVQSLTRMKEHKVNRKHSNNKTNLIDGKRCHKSNLTNRSVEFVVKGAQETKDSLQRPHTSKYSSYIS